MVVVEVLPLGGPPGAGGGSGGGGPPPEAHLELVVVVEVLPLEAHLEPLLSTHQEEEELLHPFH